MKKRNVFYLFIFLGTVFFVFRHWFLNSLIIGGDWPYYYDGFLKSLEIIPILWAPWQGNGLGGINPLLGLHVFSSSLIVPFVNWLGLPWVAVYKIGWFGLFIALSVYGSKKLWEVIDNKEQRAENKEQIADNREQNTDRIPWWVIASLIYATNTYILMVTGGGQMGVAIAYGLAPLVLASFIKLHLFIFSAKQNSKYQIANNKYIIVPGLLLGVQLMIDPRIAYVTIVAAGVYTLFMRSVLFYFFPSIIIAGLLNAFWVLPMVMMRSNPLESLGLAYTSIESIRFYSFADFSHALSLLHPNWPENIFGKTYFLRPEFLVLPLLAFSSLLNWKKFMNIVFFVILGMIGVFLAKGANEPFGGVYVWLFEHVPGFVMFRDPTKWYVLIAISYSILIPFALARLVRGKIVLIVVFILFWLFTIRQAVFGNLGGTFEKHTVPQEYAELERFLQAQPIFARTLWVPRQQRFSYGTLDHMPVEAEPLLGATTAAQLKLKLDNPTSMNLLDDLGVGYVMIPYDSLGELFLTDRNYDGKKRQEYEAVLDGVKWLTKIRSGNLTIYQIPRHRDLFWVSTDEAMTHKRLRPDRYAVSLTVHAPATVYFSQTYHPGWVLRAGNTSIRSQKSPQGLNSFQIFSPGTYEGVIEFEPQKYVTWGIVISVLTMMGVIVVFLLPKNDPSLYN